MRIKEHYRDADDMFSETRMSFGDHLEELRTALWRAIAGFLIAMILSFFISRPILSWFIIRPVEEQLQTFYDNLLDKRSREIMGNPASYENSKANEPKIVKLQFPKQVLKQLAENGQFEPLDADKLTDEEWVTITARIPSPVEWEASLIQAQTLLGKRPSMKTFSITEAFMVYFKISLVCGLVFGSPWIFWQIWNFIAAGLYPHEKRLVHVYLPISIGLFWLGVVTCQFLILPKVISALLWFNEWLNLEPDLRLNEWLGFAILLPVVFGLSFQTPLVMLFLERIGVFTVETYRKRRRIAYFILAIVSAFGPTIDAYSMIFQVIALWGLYELGVWLCIWAGRRTQTELEESEQAELIEV